MASLGSAVVALSVFVGAASAVSIVGRSIVTRGASLAFNSIASFATSRFLSSGPFGTVILVTALATCVGAGMLDLTSSFGFADLLSAKPPPNIAIPPITAPNAIRLEL